jgi:hypothetical protein
MNKEYIIGLDLGNGHFKQFGVKGELIAPSYFAKYEEFKSSMFNTGLDLKVYQDMTKNSDRFVWGKDVYRSKDKQTTSTDQNRYVLSNFVTQYRIGLVEKLVQETGIDEGTFNVHISTGLPSREKHWDPSIKSNQQLQIEDTMKQSFVMEREGKHIRVNVLSVRVMAQPLGGLFDLTLDNEGNINPTYQDIPNKNILVIDIGSGTTDLTVVHPGFIIDKDFNKSIPKGMFFAYDKISERVNLKDADANATPYSVENQILAGRRDYRISDRYFVKEFAEYQKEEMEDLANSLINGIQTYVRTRKDFDKIFLTGGGSANAHVVEMFKKWEADIIVANNPQITNAKGYFKFRVAEINA